MKNFLLCTARAFGIAFFASGVGHCFAFGVLAAYLGDCSAGYDAAGLACGALVFSFPFLVVAILADDFIKEER